MTPPLPFTSESNTSPLSQTRNILQRPAGVEPSPLVTSSRSSLAINVLASSFSAPTPSAARSHFSAAVKKLTSQEQLHTFRGVVDQSPKLAAIKRQALSFLPPAETKTRKRRQVSEFAALKAAELDDIWGGSHWISDDVRRRTSFPPCDKVVVAVRKITAAAQKKGIEKESLWATGGVLRRLVDEKVSHLTVALAQRALRLVQAQIDSQGPLTNAETPVPLSPFTSISSIAHEARDVPHYDSDPEYEKGADYTDQDPADRTDDDLLDVSTDFITPDMMTATKFQCTEVRSLKTSLKRKIGHIDELATFLQTHLSSISAEALQERIDQAQVQLQAACDKELEAKFRLRELLGEERATELARQAANSAVDELKKQVADSHRKDSGVSLDDGPPGNIYSQALARHREVIAWDLVTSAKGVRDRIAVFNGNLPERKAAAEERLSSSTKEVEMAGSQLAKLKGMVEAKNTVTRLLDQISEAVDELDKVKQQMEDNAEDWAALLGPEKDVL